MFVGFVSLITFVSFHLILMTFFASFCGFSLLAAANLSPVSAAAAIIIIIIGIHTNFAIQIHLLFLSSQLDVVVVT